MKFMGGISAQSAQQRKINERRTLLRHFATMGGTVFGPIPPQVHREFFCLDPTTWVWHEEWEDEHGQYHAVTTRYDIRPTGILKSQGTNSYQRLSEEEERNFLTAAQLYAKGIREEAERLKQIQKS